MQLRLKNILDYNEISFPYFPSHITSVYPVGHITLQQFLESHRKPKKDVQKLFSDIEEAQRNGDREKKDKLKQNLYYFTPTVDVERRSYEGILSFNPLLVAEFDKIGEEKAQELKKFVFNSYNSCICAYLSPSRNGCKFLFHIPTPKDVEEYKELYYGLAYHLNKLSGGFDFSNQSCVLPLFLSYDTDILIREEEELEEWSIKRERIEDYEEYDLESFEPVAATKNEQEQVKRIIKNIIKQADLEQTGHPNVVKAGLVTGNFCIAGYLSEQEALQYLEECIEESEYLTKNLYSYKRTARTMFERGKLQPRKLKNNENRNTK